MLLDITKTNRQQPEPTRENPSTHVHRSVLLFEGARAHMVGKKLQYVGIEFRTQRLSWNGTGEAHAFGKV